MDYDIALKEMLRNCSRPILQRWLGIPVTGCTLIEEAPQETTSLRRSDFPLRVTDDQGRAMLVLIELQTRWEPQMPLRLLEYRCRHILKERLPAISCILLLRASAAATDHYEDEEVRYQYRLIRVYEIDAEEVVKEGIVCMMPLVPLMREGEKWFRQADELIYRSDLPRQKKADMYTAMGILSGLVSEDLFHQLLRQRRKIMIESPFYEFVKQEGLEEGLQKGLQKGRQEGLEEGLERGLRFGLLEAIAFGLDLKFGVEGLKLMPEISKIEDVDMLRAIQDALRSVQSPEELRVLYK